MSFPFSVVPTATPAPAVDDSDLSGEDISLTRGEFGENKQGDLATVRGPACARQSVMREFTANQGELPRRQNWGVGIPAMLFKGVTNSVRDKIASRSRGRLLYNRRIARVHEVNVISNAGGSQVTVRADVVGGFKDELIVIKPPGVQ